MSKDPFNWMLSEAMQSLTRAERLHKRLFTVPQSGGPAWEPPIDVLETEHELLIFFFEAALRWRRGRDSRPTAAKAPKTPQNKACLRSPAKVCDPAVYAPCGPGKDSKFG